MADQQGMDPIEAARWVAGQKFGRLSDCPYLEECTRDNCGCQTYAERVVSTYHEAGGTVAVPLADLKRLAGLAPTVDRTVPLPVPLANLVAASDWARDMIAAAEKG